MTSHAFELSRLTSMEPGPRRDKIALALAATLSDQLMARAETAEVIGDLLMSLLVAASRELRISIAGKLADATWAPRELALALALEDFEIAEPVVARCRALLEDDLLTIAERGGTAHRRAIAGRPDVTERVCDAVAAAIEPEVLVALLENHRAFLSPGALRICIEAARNEAALHRPLVDRDDLPAEFVEAVYLVVADSLRAEIALKYHVDEQALRRVIGAAVREAASPDAEPDSVDEETAALIRALDDSGSLTPDFIIRAAREGRGIIFEHAVSRLADIELADVRAALAKHGPWAAALCCRTCDIQRRDFPSLVTALVSDGRLQPTISSTVERAAAQTFVSHSPASAADALRRIARAD
jgi:uncharacterized protein (DUF2336 family)